MNVTARLFDAGEMVSRPSRRVALPRVVVSDDETTGVAGMALWGEFLDHVNLVDEADRRQLRPIGPGGYTGGECLRALVEMVLAGGEFVSDRWLLAGEANDRLRGEHRLPSHVTLWRFLNGADLGRVSKAAAVLRAMVARAWAMGAGPTGEWVTIDPDATTVDVFGDKEGAAYSYKGERALSPMIGACGETGDVLGVRARGGNAEPGRAIAGFIRECVAAIPAAVREDKRLWARVDSAGYRDEVFATCEKLGAIFSVTAAMKPNVKAAIEALATDAATVWEPALGAEHDRGSQIAQTTIVFQGRRRRANGTKTNAQPRTMRLIVRRQPVDAGDQLSLDDLGGWRFHAIVTNAPADIAAVEVEQHHRLRGGIPENTIRRGKQDFGMIHAPVSNFFGNWLWWLADALALNVARWIQILALPESFHRCRAKRLRHAFLNVAARIVRHARQLYLLLPRTYAHADAFIEALTRVRQLPVYA